VLRAHPLIVALLAISLAVLVFTLTGCEPSGTHGANGDPGIVSDRDSDPARTGKKGGAPGKSADYDLQIKRPDGSTYWIDVSEDVFDHCYKRSKYPQCASN
jgi:hypothetical protein